MKLTATDKQYLTLIGYGPKDFQQIEEAIHKTSYTNGQDEKISLSKSITILGQKEFLSAIARSAFHGSAYRETKTGTVYFNSKNLFK